MNEKFCTENNIVHDTPICSFAWKIAEALEEIQRVAFEYGKTVDIDIEENVITIKLGDNNEF